MTRIRSLMLAAALAAVTLPAFAQNAAPDVAPSTPDTSTTAPAETPVPDAGMKKTPPATRTHHRVRHAHAHTVTPPAPTAKAS